MKTFKKFAFITLMQVIITAITSLIINQSLDDLTHVEINIFVLIFFSIVSFCYVYIFEYHKNRNKSKVISYTHSIFSLSALLFLFSYLVYRNSFVGFTFKIGLFQTTLGICLFLTIVFISEIYKQSLSKQTLTIRETPKFYLGLIVKVVLTLNVVLFILTSDYFWDKFVPLQIAEIIIDIFIFNLTVTIVSFTTLAAFYSILYFRKNIILGTFLAAFISGILNFYLNHFINKNVFIGYPQLFAMCFFCCFLITIQIVYRNKIQNLSLSYIKKETEYLQLKNQVNPHFLFNNLNTLIAFIETNPQKAIAFGHQLSNVYRHYLNNENDDFVLLADEIEFISEYAAIFKAKFESGFTFEVQNQANPEQYILSFSLQELMDNIFKHTILDAENPIAITISIRSDELVITNTNHKKEVLNSSKKGLNNINKRYQLLTKKEITIKETENFFEVRIPILYLNK